MAMIFDDKTEKSELQRRIAADLREKTVRGSRPEGSPLISLTNSTDEPEYSNDIKQNNARFWIAAFIASVIIIVVMLFSTLR